MLDDESDEEYLMQPFDYIEDDQAHPTKIIGQVSDSQVQHQQQSSGRLATVDIVNTTLELLSICTTDGAMTQSEDLLQAIEAEGDIEIHADEVEEVSRPLSVLSATSSKQPTRKGKGAKGAGTQLKTVQAVHNGSQLESHTEVVTAELSVDNLGATQNTPKDLKAATVAKKPKKKAHRSKRGGTKQREKQQMSKELVVGPDDDGDMYLEPSDDEEDMAAMEDYAQVSNRNR